MNTYNRLENAFLLSHMLNDSKKIVAINRLCDHFNQAQKDFLLLKITQERTVSKKTRRI